MVSGFGGPRLAAAGADLVGQYGGLSVTGLVEAASVLPRSWAMLGRLGAASMLTERVPGEHYSTPTLVLGGSSRH